MRLPFMTRTLFLIGGLTALTETSAYPITKIIDATVSLPGNAAAAKPVLGKGQLAENIFLFGDRESTGLWSMNIDQGISSLVKLVDTNTPIPGGQGNFEALSTGQISKTADRVAFVGFGSGQQAGIYTISPQGGLISIVNNQLPSPPSPKPFPSSVVGGGNIPVPVGTLVSAGNQSTPTPTPPDLRKSALILNDNLSFGLFFSTYLLTEPFTVPTAAYLLDMQQQSLMPLFKARNAACESDTTIYGQDIGDTLAVFQFYLQPQIVNPQSIGMSDLGINFPAATFLKLNGSVLTTLSLDTIKNFDPYCLNLDTMDPATVVASYRDVVPGTENDPKHFGKELTFGAPIIDKNTIVFTGSAYLDNAENHWGRLDSTPDLGEWYGTKPPDLTGLYSVVLKPERTFFKIADTNTPIPAGNGNFSAFVGYSATRDGINIPYYSVKADRVAFMARDAEQKEGVYLASTRGENLSKIIAEGDTLPDGRTVKELVINKDSLEDDRLLLFVTYGDSDTDYGYYAVDLKEKTPAEAKNCLFNWAENTYPQLLAPLSSTQYAMSYHYRYYKNSKSYVGISTSDDHVYFLDAHANLVDLGDISAWLNKAECR